MRQIVVIAWNRRGTLAAHNRIAPDGIRFVQRSRLAPPGVAAERRAPLWEVRLFGSFRVIGRDGAIATPNGRKARALLAYVVLADGETVPRERLCALLWSERGEDQARASLRQTLYEMRALTVGDGAPLIVDRSGVRIEPARLTSDRARYGSRRRRPTRRRCWRCSAIDRPNCSPISTDIDPAFDEWLAVERARRTDDRRRQVLAVGQHALAAGDAAVAHRLADRLLACDGADEAAAAARDGSLPSRR